MITIRKATQDDLAYALLQGIDFVKYHPANLQVNPNSLYTALTAVIDKGVFLLAEQDGVLIGGIGGVIVPNLFDDTYTQLSELFWWVEEQYRGGRAAHKLLSSFIKAGERHNVSAIAMCHLSTTPAMGDYYNKMGFEVTEFVYTKEYN